MRSPHPTRLLVLSLLVGSWASADQGWSDYRDPQGLFTLSHPTGWAVKPMPQINTIAVAQSDLCYVAMGAEANARRTNATQLAQQLLAGVPVRNQNGGVRQVSAMPDVACVDYVFQSPQGQPVQGRIMACADASMCYAVFYVAPQAQFGQALPVLCRIVASFRHAQVTLPAALHGGQEQQAPQPGRENTPAPAPGRDDEPGCGGREEEVDSGSEWEPAPAPDGRRARDVNIPSEWKIEWRSDDCFEAGNRKVSPTEGAMVNSYTITGDYAPPADTMVTVLSQGYGYEKVQTKSMVEDKDTAAAIARRAGRGSKVDVQVFFAKFATRDGATCLGIGYGVTIADPGARGKFSIAYAFYFAAEGRFDALVPAFERTAESILAWQGAGDLAADLGRGSVAAIRALTDAQATPDPGAAPQPSPRPRRQGGGLVDKLGSSVRGR